MFSKCRFHVRHCGQDGDKTESHHFYNELPSGGNGHETNNDINCYMIMSVVCAIKEQFGAPHESL